MTNPYDQYLNEDTEQAFTLPTEHEQRMWNHYNSIEAENHHLKRQLAKANKENKKLRRLVNKKMGKKAQQYRNKTPFHGAKK